MPTPVAGDTLTLYTLRQAQPWVKLHPSTVREQLKTGEIPARFVTRVGAAGGAGGRAGKLFMSGDQIVGLVQWFAARTAAAPQAVPADGVRRRRRVAV
jgi:hypothetical protein